jgi:hypothetical protein
LIQGQQRVWQQESRTMMEETMAVIILKIVAWVDLSAFLVTVICINSCDRPDEGLQGAIS